MPSKRVILLKLAFMLIVLKKRSDFIFIKMSSNVYCILLNTELI